MTSSQTPPEMLFSSSERTSDRNRSIKHRESLLTYLDQSAHAGDDRVRDRLECMLAELPVEAQPDLVARLSDRDDRRVKDAVTELAVHQALVELGRSDIEVAPQSESGRAADYRLSALALQFEVTRMGESDDDHGGRQREYGVVEGLNELDCGRFSLTARLVRGASSPAVDVVRTVIQDWLSSLNPTAHRAALEGSPATYSPPKQEFAFGDWRVHLTARPLRDDAPSESVIARFVEPLQPRRPNPRPQVDPLVESVRKRLKKKRSQHSRLTEPLVLVLDVTSEFLSDAQLADAFYGTRRMVGWERPVDRGALWPVTERSGHQDAASRGPLRVVGVLVLDNLHINGLEVVDATMWVPPGASTPLPSGPWRTARWDPPGPSIDPGQGGQPGGHDIVIDPVPGPQKYLLRP